jgi:hypothetical protein
LDAIPAGEFRQNGCAHIGVSVLQSVQQKTLKQRTLQLEYAAFSSPFVERIV